MLFIFHEKTGESSFVCCAAVYSIARSVVLSDVWLMANRFHCVAKVTHFLFAAHPIAPHVPGAGIAVLYGMQGEVVRLKF